MYKTSYYNFYIPVQEKHVYLLYNSRTNRLYETEEPTGRQLETWSRQDTIPANELAGINEAYARELINEGFIVDSHMNEIEIWQHDLQNYREKFLRTGLFALTILPTNSCNMACPYCFEGPDKPLYGHMSRPTMDSIIRLLGAEINKPEKAFTKLSVTWFGGEPLCATPVIEQLSEKLTALADQYRMAYKSNIITNGVNLTRDIWPLLRQCRISTVQVTIDGNRDMHNMNRPLKGKKHESFDRILDNLQHVPEDMKIQLRINVDKTVFRTINGLFTELAHRGIWPQHIKNVYLYLGHKHAASAHNSDLPYYTRQEFAFIDEEFSNMKRNFYNDWAAKNHKPPAKLAFKYPARPKIYYCITANHPYGMTIDFYGNVYKCWEYCNSQGKIAGNIHQGYDPLYQSPLFQEALHFDKIQFDAECSACKFLPICKEGACISMHISKTREKPCTPWKFKLEELLRSQYLMTIDEPEHIQSFEEAFKNQDTEKELPEIHMDH